VNRQKWLRLPPPVIANGPERHTQRVFLLVETLFLMLAAEFVLPPKPFKHVIFSFVAL